MRTSSAAAGDDVAEIATSMRRRLDVLDVVLGLGFVVTGVFLSTTLVLALPGFLMFAIGIELLTPRPGGFTKPDRPLESPPRHSAHPSPGSGLRKS
jgi:hypothetical protein